MKKFIAGLIVGLLLTSGAYAAGTIKSAEFNQGTKIQINGKAAEMEMVAVTLDGEANGKNYVGVRQLAEAMGGEVNYNDATKTIEINTEEVETVSTATEEITQTPDGVKVFQYNDENYINWLDLRKKCESLGLKFDISNHIFNFKNPDNSIICSVNLYTVIDPYDSAKYDDYVNTVLPLIN